MIYTITAYKKVDVSYESQIDADNYNEALEEFEKKLEVIPTEYDLSKDSILRIDWGEEFWTLEQDSEDF